jgi:uncharacterized iron-regulated membrane protein
LRITLIKNMKHLTRTLHLWTGLIFGAILVLQGLSGSILAWRQELDRMLNPSLLQVAPPPGMRAGAPLRLAPAAVQAATQALARDPRYGAPGMLSLPARAGEVIIAWYRPAPALGGPAWRQPVTRQVMLDPATLTVTGERNWGEAGWSRELLLPTIFQFHHYLLAGEVGKTVVAIEGVALVLAALSGIVLWWPRLTRSALWAAVTVRHGGSWPRFHFQLHRAAGFFAAPAFLVLGFSGVHFTMPQWTTPAIGMFVPVTPNDKPRNLSPSGAQKISAAEAVAAAQARLPGARVTRLNFPAKASQPYEIRLRQPGELRDGDGATRISIDARDGRVLRLADPLRASGGDAFLGTLYPLHTGEALGLPGRILISLCGLLPLGFFVTGLTVWLKLRRKKRRVNP